MGYIYRIRNLINNKIYIGQTSLYYPKTRWSAHKLEARNDNQRPLYRAIRKYGESNFSFKLLLKNIPNEQLNFYETLWIEKLKALSPNGYNLNIGGSNVIGKNNPMYGKVSPNRGKPRTDEVKQKIKDSWDKDKRERHSKMFSGENNPMYGKGYKLKGIKKWSEEIPNPMAGKVLWTKDKPNPFLGKKHTEETKKILTEKANKIPICMIDLHTGEEIKCFESIRQASLWLRDNSSFVKADHSFISKCAKGKHKFAYGYKWELKNKLI